MDYSPLSSFPLTFDPGDTSMCQIIPIFDDATFEPDEIFFVNLLSSEANVDPTRAQVAVNIINNGKGTQGHASIIICLSAVSNTKCIAVVSIHHRSYQPKVYHYYREYIFCVRAVDQSCK